jgi:hypothetical protein
VDLVKKPVIGRSQIALEFIIVYSFVLLIFLVIFALALTQRTTTLAQQQYAYLQVVAQNIATYLDQAAAGGSGYAAVMPLPVILGPAPYNVSITSTGVVLAAMKTGGQIITAQAFSNARSLSINGTLLPSSANGINVYLISLGRDNLSFANLDDIVYVNSNPSYAPIYRGSISAEQVSDDLSGSAGSSSGSGFSTVACGTVPSSVAAQIVSCIPANIVNTQSTPTPSGFQEQFTDLPFNAIAGNVVCYDGSTGALMNCWAESSSTIWMNLGSSTIGATSSANGIYYFGLGAPDANFFSTGFGDDIGEAPQLSGTYGQYDNGANVFSFYDGFPGTSLSSKWTVDSGTAGTDYNINNGFDILTTATRIQSVTSPSGNFILEAYHQFITDANNGWDFGILDYYGLHPDGSGWSLTFYYNNGYSRFGDGEPVGNGDYYLWQIVNNGGSIETNFDSPTYSNYYTASFTNTGSGPIAFGERFDGALEGQSMNDIIYWIRTRAYPPGGVMPTATYDAVQAVTYTSSTGSQPTTGQPLSAITAFSFNLGNGGGSGSGGYCGISSYGGVAISGCQSINITNPNAATGTNFQQMVYSTPQNPLDGNWLIYDTATGSPLYAWAESSNTIWIKLPGGIGSTTSYNSIRIEYTTTGNFLASGNGYTGEAPQLSSTYGEYDNGANVFNFYDNFAGTTINSQYTQVVPSGVSLTQNNGVTIATSSGAYGGLILTSGFQSSPLQVFEGDITSVSGVAAGIGLQNGNSQTSGGYVLNYWGGSVAAGSMEYGMGNTNNPDLQITTGVMSGAWLSPSSQVWYKNYVATSGSQTAYSLSDQTYPAIGIWDQSFSTSISFRWIRTRAYPPSGVMPTVTYGAVHAVSGGSPQPTGLGFVPAANSLVGFISNYGSFLPNRHSTALYTDSNGIATALLSANGGAGNADVQVFGFNGNSTTYSGLVGWWPMQEGFGNTIYDLSGHYKNGTFNSVEYDWEAMPMNQTNFQVGSFNSMTDSHIYAPSQPAALTGTIVAWVFNKVNSGESGGGYGIPVVMLGTDTAGDNGIGWGINGGAQNFEFLLGNIWLPSSPSVIIPSNELTNVAVTYAVGGSSTTLDVYVNGVLAGSGTSATVPILSNHVSIGWSGSGVHYFNGSIADVQTYNTTLDAAQISALYAEGIDSAPVQTSNLTAWWPLDGNSNDYSSYANEGINTNVAFKNMEQHQSMPGTFVANMSQARNNYITINNLNVNSTVGGYNTVSFWMYWRGQNAEMPFGGNDYDMIIWNGCIGFSAGGTDTMGSASAGLANRWVQVTALFYNGVPSASTESLYINGVLQPATATCISGTASSGALSSNVAIGNWLGTGSYQFNGSISDLQIYNKRLNSVQIQELYEAGFPKKAVVGVPV